MEENDDLPAYTIIPYAAFCIILLFGARCAPNLKDLLTKKLQGTFDLVLTNPPYRKIGSGRINPLEEKATARHEIKATLEDVLRAAHGLLKDKGRLVMIYPASRAADLIRRMAGFHLEPKRLQFVHSHENDEARLVLVEALKEGHAQVKVLPPLFLYGHRAGPARLHIQPAGVQLRRVHLL